MKQNILIIFAFLFSVGTALALDADDLNKIIKSKGLKWQAQQRSAKQIKFFGLGLNDANKPPQFPFFEPKVDPLSLPEKIDWRDIEGKNWITPVRNQSSCGSCVAFSVTALFETYLNIANNTPELQLDLSEQDLLARTGTCLNGAVFDTTLLALVRGGQPDEGCMPYKSMDISFQKTCRNRNTRTFFAERIFGVKRNQLKNALQNGPVLTGMSVYDDFFSYKTGVYKYVNGPRIGGHGVLIVGYDDSEQAFIVKNSWGPYWGDKGYFKISYDETNSGFGNSNYMLKAENPMIAANLALPASIRTYYAPTKIQARQLLAENEEPLTATLVSQEHPNQKIPLEMDPKSGSGKIDPTETPVGIYDIILNVGKDRNRWRSFFTSVMIQKIPKDLGLKLTPKFKIEDAVKDRIEFEVETVTKQENTLFEKITLIFVDKNGVERSNDMSTPDKKIIFGWRTQQVANGEYLVFARGQIGETSVDSNPKLKVKIEN